VRKPSVSAEVTLQYLEKFPEAKSLTLAKKMQRENPEIWASVDSARTAIRRYRGTHGEKDRRVILNQTHYQPLGDPKVPPFKRIPPGITTLKNWKSVKITGTHKILILPDVHIPFHNREVLELAVKYGEFYQPDIIILNGDFADHYSQSHWQKDPRKRNFPKEVETVKIALEWLRALFPNAMIYWKEGNHEERYGIYMELRAPDLLGIPAFSFENVYDLDNYGIKWINEKKPIKANELYIIHGHEYKQAFFNPVNPARGLFLRAKVNALCGHYHQPSQHSERDLDMKSTYCWSTGHLGDPHPRYAPINKWTHGFATVETHGSKKFFVQNFSIIDGEIIGVQMKGSKPEDL
jgi:predicted phosphodiesterase